MSKCRRLPWNGLSVLKNRAALVAGWSAGSELEARVGARVELSTARALVMFSLVQEGTQQSQHLP